MLVELILALVPLTFSFFFLRDGPPTPPSHSTKLKQAGRSMLKQPISNTIDDWEASEQKEHLMMGHGTSKDFTHSQSAMTIRLSKTPGTLRDDAHDGDGVAGQARSQVWEEVNELFRNRDFVLLTIAFCIGVGFFNSVMTLLNQIVGPYGYSNDDSGTFGAVFIVCGLVGAGIMGKVLETTKAYLTSLRVGIILAGLANVLCFSLLYRDNFWVLVVAFGIMGACVLPLLPTMLENCAECTYPIPEEVSAGILYSGSNLSALGFIFALQFLLEEDRLGPPPLIPSTLFIFGILILAGIVIAFYNGEYKRHKNELSHARRSTAFGGEDGKGDRGEAGEVDGYDEHTRLKHSHGGGGAGSSYVPPVLPSVGAQHQSTDVNLVRVASSDGNSINNRYSTVTGSTSMWSVS